jgi:hypothetical protein
MLRAAGPAGPCSCWPGEMVKLTEHAGLSRETVRRRLVENDLKPWREDMWCIPKVDGASAAADGGESPAWKTCSTSMPRRPTPL